jgi:hypothetical protein
MSKIDKIWMRFLLGKLSFKGLTKEVDKLNTKSETIPKDIEVGGEDE